MVSLDEFVAMVKENIKDYLPGQFQDYILMEHKVRGVNTERCHLMFFSPDMKENVKVPSLRLDGAYESYKKGESLSGILEELAEQFIQGYEKSEDLEVNIDYDNLPDRVIMTVINTKENRELLAGIPHRDFLDISVIYRCIHFMDDHSLATSIINNYIMNEYGLTEEELFTAAVVNTREKMEAVSFPMIDNIKRCIMLEGIPEVIAERMAEIIPEEKLIWSITNSHGIYGASAMLYEENLYKVAQEVQNDLYVIPDSINGVMAVSVEVSPLSELKDILRISAEEIPPEDKLSDRIYYYSREERKLTMANDDR